MQSNRRTLLATGLAAAIVSPVRAQENGPRYSAMALQLVCLDLDDTLIDCRHRKHRVFMDFIAQPAIRQRHADASARLAELRWEDIHYRVPDNLKFLAIEDRVFGEELFLFWQRHYFTYPYLLQDQAFPGALHFVKQCFETEGLGLVYLTGRDVPGMGRGTFESLRLLGFPTEGPDVHVLLKPDPSLHDLHFKRDALEAVDRLGPVLAAFENELPNLNVMAERFPAAAMYWRKTLFAPDPPLPHPRVKVLLNFPPAGDGTTGPSPALAP